MNERTINLMKQLLLKTSQGKITWSRGFEDGQFKTILPGGKLAFVVQEKHAVLRFSMYDEKQEMLLDEQHAMVEATEQQQQETSSSLWVGCCKLLYDAARQNALQIDDRLQEAEKLLSAI